MATLLGGLIGFEREWNNHAAGFRTHILVCLGSAMIMLLSMYGFSEFVNEVNVRMDPARLAAQVISGIGFLGAGAIMRNGSAVKGLTTAASVWVVAAIGLCVGAGFYIGSFICTFLVLVSLHLFNRWEKHLLRRRRYHEVELTMLNVPGALESVIRVLGEFGVQVGNLKMHPTYEDADTAAGPDSMELSLLLNTKKPESLILVYEKIAALGVIVSVDAKQFVVRKHGSVTTIYE
ncbi:MgtC/SapB family protein [Paenibacillus nasutitermitis]|nr:MgtC/SapB family protein [Paenibacillus nasutitermitis]